MVAKREHGTKILKVPRIGPLTFEATSRVAMPTEKTLPIDFDDEKSTVVVEMFPDDAEITTEGMQRLRTYIHSLESRNCDLERVSPLACAVAGTLLTHSADWQFLDG